MKFKKLKSDKKFRGGVFRAAFAEFCCFTPSLLVVLGILGLSAVLGYLDYVIYPALVFFLILIAYSVIVGLKD